MRFRLLVAISCRTVPGGAAVSTQIIEFQFKQFAEEAAMAIEARSKTSPNCGYEVTRLYSELT